MILIVAQEHDSHALCVAKAIYEARPDVGVTIVDAQEFPEKSSLTIGLDHWELRLTDGRIINSQEIHSVWWRRSFPHEISRSVRDPTARSFCANESSQAFRSLAYWPTYKVVNDVERERRASHKPLQHCLAARVGFKVPQTIVTNDPGRVVEFCKDHNEVIYKVMTTPISLFAETRRFSNGQVDLLNSLSHAPVIFQREIKKARDIRVTVVGERLFPAAVKGKVARGELFPDWRMDATAECFEIELPADIERKIIELVAQLGLEYAAIDFIEDEDGEYIFLEVNPSGQYLFVEIDTGQAISAAIADILISQPHIGS